VGESDAGFREFFEAEYRPLRRLGYLLTGDWSQAEDLAQEALMRTYRSWNRIRERERPGAYARTILVNQHRSAIRRLFVARKHTPEDPGQRRLFDEDGMVLWEALLRLPERQRAALVLRYYEDLPEAEIALVMECPLGTVKSHIHRGIERLRAALGPAFQMPAAEGDAS